MLIPDMDVEKFTKIGEHLESAPLDQKGWGENLKNSTDRVDILNYLYLDNIHRNHGFDILFNFADANERGLRFSFKERMKYAYDANGTAFDPSDPSKRLVYTKPEYKHGYMSLKPVLSVSRQYESLDSLTPELITSEIREIIEIESQTKQKLILDEMIEVGTPILIPETQDIKATALDIHDSIVDIAQEENIELSKLIVISRMSLIRGLRNITQITEANSILISDIMQDKGIEGVTYFKSIEGVTYISIPDQIKINPEEGGVSKVDPFSNPDILCVSFEYDPKNIMCREKVHTPARLEIAPVGIGTGAVPFLEAVTALGVGIVDATKIMKVVIDRTPEETQKAAALAEKWKQEAESNSTNLTAEQKEAKEILNSSAKEENDQVTFKTGNNNFDNLDPNKNYSKKEWAKLSKAQQKWIIKNKKIG